MTLGQLHVEFLGLARHRAGVPGTTVPPGRLGLVLAAIQLMFPALKLIDAGRPSQHYLLSLDGDRFLDADDCELLPGQVLLILGADAGG